MAQTWIYIFYILLLFQCCVFERRIKDGQVLSSDKRYVVYFSKAPASIHKYDAWICGGAIVSVWYIITSAACIEDVRHMYAIAGYKKYVKNEDLKRDKCTRNTIKKVVYTCVPKTYKLVYEKIEKWSLIDIALAKVESAYILDDDTVNKHCSYSPTAIPINYDQRYQEKGIDVMVMGWGHSNKWRQVNDPVDYNQKTLHYASTRIYDKTSCKQHYPKEMHRIIDKYMICTYGSGNLNDNGDIISSENAELVDGCVYEKVLLNGVEYLQCRTSGGTKPLKNTRRNISKDSEQNETLPTRRQGICQNDHGGPLVAWKGSHEVLIGIASVFRVTLDMECVGPYLFTSTQCNGIFLDCVLSYKKKEGRRHECDLPPRERGFDIIERKISWMDHPDGPAANERIEKIQIRPQVPIDRYG